MSAGPLVLELILMFIGTVFVLNKYGNWRKQHFIVTLSTLVGWYFAFIIVFILPLDVALTFYRNCLITRITTTTSTSTTSGPVTTDNITDHLEKRDALDDAPKKTSSSTGTPTHSSVVMIITSASSNLSAGHQAILDHFACRKPGNYVPDEVLLDLWRIVYWTSQILTWLILPMMQSYANSGEFTVLGKLRAALYENAIYYGSYLLIFGVLLIYVAVKGFNIEQGNEDLSFSEKLKIICITASNTWGLFLLVLLLGYGLVEVPRQFWQAGNKGYRLQKTYFDIEKLSTDKNDAEETVKEAFRDTESTISIVRSSSGPYMGYADTIMSKFPVEIASELRRRAGRSGLNDTDAANMTATSERHLVRLHKRVIEALQSHHRTQAQWNDLVGRALHLEEVAKNETNGPMQRKQFLRTYRAERGIVKSTICTPAIEWYWECLVKRPLLKGVAVFMVFMSFFIIWSECTFFSVKPTLSIAAIFVASAASNYSYGYIELSSIVTIAYMCMCAYYTVFKVRIYRYYHLDPHHQTDSNSLLFSAILLCRLTPPLCLNFLGMIHLDTHVASQTVTTETSYTTIMGHMDVIKFIARGFNVYFPMAILILCLGTYFRLGTRCLHQMGIDQFVGDDEMTSELVQGGRALVQAERNRLQREANREARQEFWQEKLADHDSSRPLRRNFGGDSSRSYRERNLQRGGRNFRSEPSGGYGGRLVGGEYSDQAAIIPEMEEHAVDQDIVEYQEDLYDYSGRSRRPDGRGLRKSDYGSPESPPRGIFDDL